MVQNSAELGSQRRPSEKRSGGDTRSRGGLRNWNACTEANLEADLAAYWQTKAERDLKADFGSNLEVDLEANFEADVDAALEADSEVGLNANLEADWEADSNHIYRQV